MCSGVIVITSTIATCPHSIAIRPSHASPLASSARTEAGDASGARHRGRRGMVVDHRHGPRRDRGNQQHARRRTGTAPIRPVETGALRAAAGQLDERRTDHRADRRRPHDPADDRAALRGGIERGGAVARDAVGAVADAEHQRGGHEQPEPVRADGGGRRDRRARGQQVAAEHRAPAGAGPRPRISSDDPMAVPSTVTAEGTPTSEGCTCSASAISAFTVYDIR